MVYAGEMTHSQHTVFQDDGLLEKSATGSAAKAAWMTSRRFFFGRDLDSAPHIEHGGRCRPFPPLGARRREHFPLHPCAWSFRCPHQILPLLLI